MVILVVLAVWLRRDWSYRTAFVDEAINLFGAWQWGHGHSTGAPTYQGGWYPLTYLPLGVPGWLGGVAAARAVNSLWGVLTVLLVALTARRLYGRTAGYVAGGIFAVYGPAIFISTLATYDSLSAMLTALAIYVWVGALLDGTERGLWLGSLILVIAALTKYTAALCILAALACGAALFVEAAARGPGETLAGRTAEIRRKLGLVALPVALLLVYALVYRRELASAFLTQTLAKRQGAPGYEWVVLRGFAMDLAVPLLCAPLAFLERGRSRFGLGLVIFGTSILWYQVLNREVMTLHKHTCIALVAMAPLAGGGLGAVARRVGERLPRIGSALAGATLCFVVVLPVGIQGRMLLPGLRTSWSDVSKLVPYLRENVRDGDVVLMEGGWVGGYYLIQEGVPGHVPSWVWSTWWYSDDLGHGEEALSRGVSTGRFDWIVLDGAYTAALNSRLSVQMDGRYDLVASFPALRFGSEGEIRVFRPKARH